MSQPRSLHSLPDSGFLSKPGSLQLAALRFLVKWTCPRCPQRTKAPWVRVADPSRAEVHLTAESRSAVKWLQQCFTHERLRPLQQAPLLACFAAADAMADEKQVGIGGWIVTSSHCAWFAEHWTAEQVRALWPQLTRHPQQYIACFETIAQLALAMAARKALGATTWKFALPSASDYTAAESRTEKL